jgi:hypothetical protein
MFKRNAKKHPFIPLHAPIFIKLIDFNEKVVSDVTSETTFSLKSIYLMKREDERGMRGACVAPLNIFKIAFMLPKILKIFLSFSVTNAVVLPNFIMGKI